MPESRIERVSSEEVRGRIEWLSQRYARRSPERVREFRNLLANAEALLVERAALLRVARAARGCRKCEHVRNCEGPSNCTRCVHERDLDAALADLEGEETDERA